IGGRVNKNCLRATYGSDRQGCSIVGHRKRLPRWEGIVGSDAEESPTRYSRSRHKVVAYDTENNRAGCRLRGCLVYEKNADAVIARRTGVGRDRVDAENYVVATRDDSDVRSGRNGAEDDRGICAPRVVVTDIHEVRR